jgi:hypothetical protein
MGHFPETASIIATQEKMDCSKKNVTRIIVNHYGNPWRSDFLQPPTFIIHPQGPQHFELLIM